MPKYVQVNSMFLFILYCAVIYLSLKHGLCLIFYNSGAGCCNVSVFPLVQCIDNVNKTYLS